MSRNFVILFCIISIFLFAETDLEKEDLKGKVNTYLSYSYQPDPDSEELNWILDYSPYGEKKEYFNEKGMIIKEEIFAEDGKIYGGSTYEYDDQNNLVLIIDYDQNNEIDKIYKYKFDDEGNTLEEYCCDADSNFVSIYNFIYDENGYKIESECYDSSDNCTEAFKYKYDDNGNVIEQIVINYDWVQDRTVYSYDSNNRMIENRIYDPDDNLIEVTTIEYNENDDYASIFKEKIEAEEYLEYIFQYNENNQMIEAKIFKNDQLFKTDIYEYNDKGDDTAIIMKFSDRMESYTYEYIYDDKGNWIEKTESLNDEPVKRSIQEITYYD